MELSSKRLDEQRRELAARIGQRRSERREFFDDELRFFARHARDLRWGISISAPVWFETTHRADSLSSLFGRNDGTGMRIKTFTSTTQFASAAHSLPTFDPPVSIHQALRRTIAHEFLRTTDERDIVFYSE